MVDDISGGVLNAIIFFPVPKELGVNWIHFAAILCVNLGLVI
jgi:TRAP-type C4-dicarboxylate transport system permease large subunit